MYLHCILIEQRGMYVRKTRKHTIVEQVNSTKLPIQLKTSNLQLTTPNH